MEIKFLERALLNEQEQVRIINVSPHNRQRESSPGILNCRNQRPHR